MLTTFVQQSNNALNFIHRPTKKRKRKRKRTRKRRRLNKHDQIFRQKEKTKSKIKKSYFLTNKKMDCLKKPTIFFSFFYYFNIVKHHNIYIEQQHFIRDFLFCTVVKLEIKKKNKQIVKFYPAIYDFEADGSSSTKGRERVSLKNESEQDFLFCILLK